MPEPGGLGYMPWTSAARFCCSPPLVSASTLKQSVECHLKPPEIPSPVCSGWHLFTLDSIGSLPTVDHQQQHQ